MIHRWLFKKVGQRTSPQKKTAEAPENTRIYAVADIHGCLNELRSLQHKIAADAQAFSGRKLVIYLGDYVDRGPDSKGVLDTLIASPLKDFEYIFLKGNHDYAMEMFLRDSALATTWMSWGGDATLASYNVNTHDETGKKRSSEALQHAFKKAIPEQHLHFLANLKLHHVEGDYLFVHAGVNPDKPLKHQSEADLMMSREEFLAAPTLNVPHTIVFGHTVMRKPLESTQRIGIDLGAYAGHPLTAVVLEGQGRRYIYST